MILDMFIKIYMALVRGANEKEFVVLTDKISKATKCRNRAAMTALTLSIAAPYAKALSLDKRSVDRLLVELAAMAATEDRLKAVTFESFKEDYEEAKNLLCPFLEKAAGLAGLTGEAEEAFPSSDEEWERLMGADIVFSLEFEEGEDGSFVNSGFSFEYHS